MPGYTLMDKKFAVIFLVFGHTFYLPLQNCKMKSYLVLITT